MCSRKVSAGTTLLKSLSAVISSLNTPEIYIFFNKEHLRKVAKAIFTYFNVISLQFKIQRCVYSAHNETFFSEKLLIRCLAVWKKNFFLNIPLILSQQTNYVIIIYFFIIFWLQKNVTKKWPFYYIILVQNQNVLKYNVILTSSKNVATTNK